MYKADRGRLMMANLDCKLDRTSNHLGYTLSGVSEEASTEIYLR